MAVAGLILSILALVGGFIGFWVAWLPFGFLVLAIVGVVLSALAGKKQKSGVATAGLVIGIIAIVLNAISAIACTICVVCVASAANALSGLAVILA